MNANLGSGRGLHDEFRMLAAASVDGRLSSDEAAALEAHLAGCPVCRADLAGMVQDHAWLSAPGAVPAPDGRIREAVLAAARSARVPRTGDRQRPWEVLVAASLMVAVVGAGILFAANRGPGAGTPGNSATRSPTPTGTLSPAAAGQCVPIPPGLSARWTFDEPTERLSGVPLQLFDNAKFVAGLSGTALHLDGEGTSSRADVNDPGIAAIGTEDFTISLWVRFLHLKGEQVLAERWALGTRGEGWTLTKLATGELRLALATDRVEAIGEFDLDSVGAGLVPEAWHHVVARRLQRTFWLFVDGRQVAGSTLPAGVTADLTAALPLKFGLRGPNDSGLRLDGDLDEALFWTGRALSNVEIGELDRAGSAGFCEAAAGAGYDGSWQATDCAASGPALNCGLWGDGSQLRLDIGSGEQPEARFRDTAAAGCGPDGTAGPGEATGRAKFEGVHLWITFTNVTCMATSDSYQNPMQLYKALSDAGLWQDPDGDEWGIVWRPG